MTILRRNLDLDVDANTAQGWATELKELSNVMVALESKVKAVNESRADVSEYMTLLERVKNDWASLPFDRQKRFVNLSTASMVLTTASPHIFKVAVHWSDPYNLIDVGFIWDVTGDQRHWDEDEDTILRDMYPTADRADMLRLLPTRSWTCIADHSRRLGLTRSRGCLNSLGVHPSLSLEDAALVECEGIQLSDELLKGGCYWTEP